MKAFAPWVGLPAVLGALLLSAGRGAPLPAGKARTTPQEDQNNIIQKKGDLWITPWTQMTVDGKKKHAALVLIFWKESPYTTVTFPGHKEFKKKGKVRGVLELGVATDDGTTYTSTCYRLEEQGKKKVLVLPDGKGGELVFDYDLSGKALKIKGGKGVAHPSLKSFPIDQEYKRLAFPHWKEGESGQVQWSPSRKK